MESQKSKKRKAETSLSLEHRALDLIDQALILLEDQVVKFANKAALEIIGISKDKAIGASLTELFAEKSSREIQDSLKTAKSSYDPLVKKNLALSDGQLVDVSVALLNSSEICINIKKSAHAERLLEKDWIAIFEKYSDVEGVIVEYDERLNDLINLFCSSATSVDLSTHSQQLYGKKWKAELGINKSDVDSFIHQMNIILKDGKSTNVSTNPLSTKKGIIKQYQTTIRFLQRSSSGNSIFHILMKDVTSFHSVRSEKEEKLLDLETTFRHTIFQSCFEISPLCVACLETTKDEKDLRFLMVNEKQASVLGKRPKDFEGLLYSSIGATPEMIKWVTAKLKESKVSGKPVYYETKSVVFQGGVDCIAKHIGDNMYLVVAADVTSKREMKEKLSKQHQHLEDTVKHRTRDLEEALQVKTRFLAIMSHEIRTPLTGVMGTLSMLSDTGLPQESKQLVRTAQICGEQLMTVLNDVLDLSKMEENKMSLEHTQFSLHNVIEDSMEVVSFEVESKNLELIADIDLCSLQDNLKGDAIRLRQILVNLLSNAVKFSFRGEIVVSAESRDLGNGKCEIAFAVKDDGIGISKEAQEKLFKPFSQVDTSVTRRYGGSGLGLTISKKLTELMNGEMSIDSSEGKGSIFRFTVKMDKGVNHSRRFSADKRYMKEHTIREVYIIDQSATVRKVLARNISKLWDLKVTALSTAKQSLKELEGRIDLFCVFVLVDLKEPPEEIQKLKNLMRNPSNMSVMGFTQGTDETLPFLKKPVRMVSLKSRLFGYDLDMQLSDERLHLQATENFGELHILVAEDNITNQRLILQLLTRVKCKQQNITIVGDGKQAVEAVKHQKYDVILMDLMMPEMGGLEATEGIRKLLPKNLQPYIVALTASAFEEDRLKCLQVGMNEVITKPINRLMLNKALSNAFTNACKL